MEIHIRRQGEVIVLDLCGRIDVDAANFVETVGLCIRSRQADILCNFEEVEFVDYTGISVIVVAYKEVVNNNGRMKFVNVPTHIKTLFSISGLDKTFEIYPTEEMALDAFKEDIIIEKIRKKKSRRRFTRLPIEIKVDFKEKYRTASECRNGQIIDLSAQGAYIYGCNQYSLGDILELEMNLPKLVSLKLDAKVVWLSDKQIQPQYHPGMGVEFYNISTQMQKKILEFIDKNMASMPKDN